MPFAKSWRAAGGALLAALLAGCASLYFRDAGAPPEPAPQYRLQDWPYREYWQAVVFNGEKIGFSRSALVPGDAERYTIRSEAVFVLRFLGIEKRFNVKTVDEVHADLTLARFIHDYEIDGNHMGLTGHVEGERLHVIVASGGRQSTETHVLAARPYPASAIAFYPLLHGLRLGAEYRYPVFHGQLRRIAEVTQRVEAYEKSRLFQGAAWRVATELHGQASRMWMDERGRPLLELALGGVLICGLEDERTARRDLIAASLNKRETLLEYSLVRTPRLPEPRRVRYLKATIAGAAVAVPSDGLQACAREGEVYVCEVRALDPDTLVRLSAGAEGFEHHLAPSVVAPSHDPRIQALAREIAGDAATVTERIARLVAWMDRHIRKEPVDVFSALDVLRDRRAECQGHTYLYTALARALGLPTRMVHGLVYSEALEGFLYHSWAETRVGDAWLPVDATLGQLGVDATHIKLIEGEDPADLVPLVDMIGKLRLEIRAYAVSGPT